MSTYPAIKGKMGSINYFSFTLPAHELANLARPAYEYVGEEIWDDQKLSERVQRKPSYNRAKKDIASYLVNNEDRFFSSVCVFIHGGDIKFVEFKKGVVTVQLQGSCAGCPSSTMTLKQGVQNLLTHYIPDVKQVEAI